jgi:serine/threonine-protein kinase
MDPAAQRSGVSDYSLERELGRGGMATVYLAHDARHGRRVAIKVLHAELAAVVGTERFLREIRVIATLQHPHIVGLIDSGVFGADAGELAGRPYYVMPYIGGESLRQRLQREGQLPVGDALRLTREVAAALDYAHRQGVIHRDVKPENILLSDGSALVTDFGIALALEQAGGGRMTQTGLSLGTPHYMSPEQAMGERTITARSDVYSLGAVAYEMLAGEPPFTGPSAQAIVARVLSESPRPLRVLRPSVPAHAETAIVQALDKLPADRFSTAAEFSAALAGGPTMPALAAGAPAAPASGRRRAAVILPWLIAAGALGVAAFVVRSRPAPGVPAVYRFEVALPRNAEWVGDIVSAMALSPDGIRLAYNGRDSSGERRLYLRAMDRLDPVAVPGSENAAAPFFSPDGRWIGFRVGTRMVRAPVAGGAPEPICETGSLSRAVWLERDVIVFADPRGLRQCTMAGEVTTLLAADPGEAYRLPHGLPGDRGIVFSIERESVNRLVGLDLASMAVKDLGVVGADPRYVATGHLAYLGPDGLLRAIGFDAEALATRGEPVVVDDSVPVALGAAMMAVSRNGTTVTAGVTAEHVIELVDRSGRAERLHPRPGGFAEPSVSPDGRRLALRAGDDIWILDRAQRLLTRLSFDSSASRPAWSPDGRQIAYLRQIGATMSVRVMPADGSGPAQPLPAPPGREPWEVLFTRDGAALVVRTVGGLGSRDIWLVPLDSTLPPRELLSTPADEVAPALSPDGRWMAYVSNESGRAEVYVRTFPGMGGRYQVSLEGGTEPVWSVGGDELFYRSGPAVIAAAVRTTPALEVVRRTDLFSDPLYAGDLTHRMYDVTPDGRHFVMMRRLEGTSHLSVTLNRFHHLESSR